MSNKEKRPAEIAAPSGTITIALPDYNMFSGEEQEKFLKAMELIGMALQVNGMEYTRNNTIFPENNLPAICAYFSGHVMKMHFHCYMNGYYERCNMTDEKEYQEKELYLDKISCEKYQQVHDWLHGILMRMKS